MSKAQVQRQPVRHSCEGERERSLLSKGRTQSQWKRATGERRNWTFASLRLIAAMTALLLDTLRLSRALQDKGNFTSEQAEALAEALGEASQGDLATKTDLAGVRTEIAGLKTELKTELAGIGTEIAELRTELKSEIAGARGELKSDIAGVGTEIAELRTELKTKIDSVRAELKADNAELRTELKAEIAETRKDLLKWIIGAIGFQTVVILGALISIFTIFAK
jgi:hypothetical protein